MVPPPKHLSGFTSKIKRLCKQDNDFPAAEVLFHTLLFDRLRLISPTDVPADNLAVKYTRAHPPITEEEIRTFQNSLTTLIRYSPTKEDALKYTCFMLAHFDAPLRTRHLEQCALINVIYVLKTRRAYDQALDFIRIGLERGILLTPSAPNQSKFEASADVFRSVCIPVLVYHKLQFSDDRLSLEPCTGHHRA